jgi:hypothetical protein
MKGNTMQIYQNDLKMFEVLDPASLEAHDRAHLTRSLEKLGLRRLSVEHAMHRQTLKKVGDQWLITCSNVKF